jgi:hypothetical protein
MLKRNFVPKLPFPDFKWKWASVQCTEGLNDPIVLFGVLSRLRKLELKDKGLKYSSEEFANELRELSNDIPSAGINLADRVGDRNIIRNSGQYWRGLGLLEGGDHSGAIRLTDFGRRVADHDVSQTEFAATTVQSFKLPNPRIQSREECQKWLDNGLAIYPLRLLMAVLRGLHGKGHGFITTEELI